MKKSLFKYFIFLFPLVFCLFSCKSAFERIRTSNDAELIYKEALKYYEAEEYQKAQTLFELAISGYRGRREAEDINFKYAYTYYHLGSYILAAYYFKNFAQTFSTSPKKEEADFMIAYSNYQLSPTFRLDQSYTQEAIDAFQLYVNTYPTSDRVEECNNLIDALRKKLETKAFETGKLYYDLQRYQACIQTFENLVKDFPDTDNIAEVRYMIVRAAYEYAKNSIVDRKEERFKDTLEKANFYLEKHQDSYYSKEVNSIIDASKKELN